MVNDTFAPDLNHDQIMKLFSCINVDGVTRFVMVSITLLFKPDISRQFLCIFGKNNIVMIQVKYYGINPRQRFIKVPIAANWKGICLQNASKPHSYHLKIW